MKLTETTAQELIKHIQAQEKEAKGARQYTKEEYLIRLAKKTGEIAATIQTNEEYQTIMKAAETIALLFDWIQSENYPPKPKNNTEIEVKIEHIITAQTEFYRHPIELAIKATGIHHPRIYRDAIQIGLEIYSTSTALNNWIELSEIDFSKLHPITIVFNNEDFTAKIKGKDSQ